MAYLDIMETISEELPKKKCSSCGCLRELCDFGPNGRNGCFKTCQKCRGNKKKSRDKKANSKKSEPVLTLDDYVRDEWADMTAELLESLTYEEKCAIRFNKDTVVTKLNILFMCQNIIRYCGPDPSVPIEETGSVPVGTIMGPETIEVHLPDRGAHFTVNIGDTWREIRENIHCS